MDSKESQLKKEKEPKAGWQKWDTFFSIYAILFILLLPLGGGLYICGLLSPYSYIFFAWFFLPVSLAFFICSIPIYTIRICLLWRSYTKKQIVGIICQNGLVAFFIVSLFTLNGFWIAGYKTFTYGFKQRIQMKTDIPTIQKWLKTVKKEVSNDYTLNLPIHFDAMINGWPDSIKWPECLTTFKTHYGNLELNDEGDAKIRLTWGGAFSHWGFEVGPVNMKIPPSDFGQRGEYRLPLAPGAYAWYELK